MKPFLLAVLFAVTCHAAETPKTTTTEQKEYWFNVLSVDTNEPLASVNVKTNKVKYYTDDKDAAFANLYKGYIGLQGQCQQAVTALQDKIAGKTPALAKKDTKKATPTATPAPKPEVKKEEKKS